MAVKEYIGFDPTTGEAFVFEAKQNRTKQTSVTAAMKTAIRAALNVPASAEGLVPANDLSDVANVATSRSNLSVYSKDETNDRTNSRLAANGVFLNGTDAYLAIADSSLLSFGDGTSDKPFTMIAWLNPTDATSFEIVSRDQTGGTEEWSWLFNASDKQYFEMHDDSAAVSCYRLEDTASVSDGITQCVAVTYDGTGGASAANGITLYNDEGSVASTATNNASYVAMEDLSQETRIGRRDSNYSEGKLHGLLIFNRELSASEIAAIMATPIVDVADQWGNNTALIADGDMEAAGVASWTVTSAGVTATKETGTPYEGSNVIRLTHTGTGTAYAGNQNNSSLKGKRVHIKGRARSDGNRTPSLRLNGSTWQIVWTGTTSTSWQEIDVVVVANDDSSVQLTLYSGVSGSASEYVEFDAMEMHTAGAVVALLPESVEADGSIRDSSSNGLHAAGTNTEPLRKLQVVDIDAPSPAANSMLLDVKVAGSSLAGIDAEGTIRQENLATDAAVAKYAADAITTAGTVSHQIPIDIGGTIYYLVAHTHGS